MMSFLRNNKPNNRNDDSQNRQNNINIQPASPKLQSLCTLASRRGVEEEKCVVSQYRTSFEQREIFSRHIEKHPKNHIPIEWVIDIADESSGWFYATAYHFDDTTNMLHVMVPDKSNPSFDGNVPLDHRTVHMIECVDGNSDALFNRIVRDSVIKVKWDVEWFEEDPTSTEDVHGDVKGRWIQSCARYYIRIANQILVEDTDTDDGTRGYVMLVADTNIRLVHCHKGKGLEDFTRLVLEGIVQSNQDIIETANESNVPESIDELDHGDIYGPKSKSKQAPKAPMPDMSPTSYGAMSPDLHSYHDGSETSFSNHVDSNQIRKLTDISHHLKECVSDLLDERDEQIQTLRDVALQFKSFALSGDLSAGLKLSEKLDAVLAAKDKQGTPASDSQHTDKIDYDVVADDAWRLSNKLEKGLVKLSKSSGDGAGSAGKDVDQLKRMINKLMQDVDDRDEEIRILKSSHRRT